MNYETIKYLLNEKNCEWEIKETNQFKSLKEADKKFNELMEKEKRS